MLIQFSGLIINGFLLLSWFCTTLLVGFHEVCHHFDCLFFTIFGTHVSVDCLIKRIKFPDVALNIAGGVIEGALVHWKISIIVYIYKRVVDVLTFSSMHINSLGSSSSIMFCNTITQVTKGSASEFILINHFNSASLLFPWCLCHFFSLSFEVHLDIWSWLIFHYRLCLSLSNSVHCFF